MKTIFNRMSVVTQYDKMQRGSFQDTLTVDIIIWIYNMYNVYLHHLSSVLNLIKSFYRC